MATENSFELTMNFPNNNIEPQPQLDSHKNKTKEENEKLKSNTK